MDFMDKKKSYQIVYCVCQGRKVNFYRPSFDGVEFTVLEIPAHYFSNRATV